MGKEWRVLEFYVHPTHRGGRVSHVLAARKLQEAMVFYKLGPGEILFLPFPLDPSSSSTEEGSFRFYALAYGDPKLLEKFAIMINA